jgi:hypothetical protein
MNPSSPDTSRRPRTVVATITLLLFLGASALGGGIAMLVPATSLPDEWLADIPIIDSWTIPALVLGVGFGVGGLVVGIGMILRWRCRALAWLERATRHHWTWAGALALGAGQIAWISLELVYLEDRSALQVVYGAVGVALVAFALLRPVRRYLARQA